MARTTGSSATPTAAPQASQNDLPDVRRVMESRILAQVVGYSRVAQKDGRRPTADRGKTAFPALRRPWSAVSPKNSTWIAT